MSRIALRYEDKNVLTNQSGSKKTNSTGTTSPVVSNGNCIRKKLMQARGQQNRSPVDVSRAASTVIPSEINGGITRMNLSNRLQNPAPSVVASTVVPSEINNGATRMNMKRNRGFDSNNTNGRAHMPAGFERDSHDFNKHNNRL